jgi:general secretion pathway protein G
MCLLNRQTRRRRGITFVEMLAGVFIVGVLASLITIAATKVMSKAKEPNNRMDMNQIQVGLEIFKTRFGFYPPSRLLLCENYLNYFIGNSPANPFVSPLAQDSVWYLQRMFPRIDLGGWSSTGIDWNGNGNALDPPVILEGDQCLVFFLGGVPGPSAATGSAGVAPSLQGFSTDPRNPASPTDDRLGPFCDFQFSRLVILPVGANPLGRSTLHYSYLDRYGSSDGLGSLRSAMFPYPVYAYFSGYKFANGYNRYFNPALYPFSDCPTLLNGVPPTATTPNWPCLWPYAETRYRYMVPNSYQLISAGADGVFGSGSVPQTNALGQITGFNPTWTAALASTIYPPDSPGHDDQSNFCSALLGVGSE